MSFGKLTFDALKVHLWAAADILRGSLDANEYRQPIMTLLFLKCLNDQFEERAEELERKGKSKNDAWEDPDRHSFFVRLRMVHCLRPYCNNNSRDNNYNQK